MTDNLKTWPEEGPPLTMSQFASKADYEEAVYLEKWSPRIWLNDEEIDGNSVEYIRADLVKQEPMAYFQKHPISGTYEEVLPSFAGEPGVIVAYKYPPELAIPEGWKLVPIEPTDLMLGKGLHHVPGMVNLPCAYKAMLSAAPEYKKGE